jgi:16S rRNA processing protein RimM
MGQVIAPFGIKGWIKIQPFTEQVGGLAKFPEWWLGVDGDFHPHKVIESAVHGQTVVARLERIEDRQAAALFKGQEIAVPRDQLPEADLGSYYWDDLIGCEVINGAGESLGSVASFMATGANSVMVVAAERERLLPFVDGVILNVDLTGRKILVDWEIDF